MVSEKIPTLREARAAVDRSLQRFEPKKPQKRGLVGHPNGVTVDVPNRPDFIYIRLRGDNTALWEVLNAGTPLKWGSPVIIELIDAQKGIWAVKEIDRAFFSDVGGWQGSPNTIVHAPSHEWPNRNPGDDPVNIYPRAIAPLRAFPVADAGLEVFVSSGVINNYRGDLFTFTGGSVTISGGELPIAGQARYALISVDLTDILMPTVIKTLGDATLDNESVALPVPAVPAKNVPAALVVLRNGDTQLTEDRFDDWRMIVGTPDNPMRWAEPWIAKAYIKDDVVRDGDWLMIANTDTIERAGPQILVDATFQLPDSPIWTPEVNSAFVLAANEYTMLLGLLSASKMRYYVDTTGAGYSYQVFIRDVTDPGEIFDLFTSAVFTNPALGWNEVATPEILMVQGRVYSIIVGVQNVSATTPFSGQWTRGPDSQAGAPASGQWLTNSQHAFFRVSKTDNAAADRSAELIQWVAGTTVIVADVATPTLTVTWQLNSAPNDMGTAFEWDAVVISGAVPPVGNLDNLDATVPTPGSTDIVNIAGHWTANPPVLSTVRGLLSVAGAPSTPSDNAWPVDIFVALFTVSPDWDLLARSGGAGGGTVAPGGGSEWTRVTGPPDVLHPNELTDLIGIGIATPDSMLHIHEGSAGIAAPISGTVVTIERDNIAYLSFLTPDANQSGLFFGGPSFNVDGGFIYNSLSTPRGFQFRVDGNQVKFIMTQAGKLGINTALVPYQSVGLARVAVHGTDASADGPHVQYTTDQTDHPLFQQRNWSHDNISMAFDAYHNGTGWVSSDIGSNFKIQKTGDLLRIDFSSGTAAGGFTTFELALSIDAAGDTDFDQNSLRHAVIDPLATPPSVATEVSGQMYYDTGSNDLFVWTGAAWTSLTSGGGEWIRVAGTPDVLHPINPTTTEVGIGTTSPDGLLHVFAGESGTSPFNNSLLTVEHNDDVYVSLLAPNDSESGIFFGNVTSNIDGGIVYNNPVTPQAMQFRVNNNSTKMIILSDGKVGIGTTTPDENLVVAADDDARIVMSLAANINGAPILQFRKHRGTHGTPLILAQNDIIAQIVGQGFDGSALVTSGIIRYYADAVPTLGVVPGRWEIETTNSAGARATRMTLTAEGKLGLGTATVPHGAIGGAKFQIDGTVNSPTAGPHVQYSVTTDNYPIFQQLNFAHDNVAFHFDAYYDGAFRSSDIGSNYQIYKASDKLTFGVDSGIAQGSVVTFDDILTMFTNRRVGINIGGVILPETVLHVETTIGGEGAVIGKAFAGNYISGDVANFSHWDFRASIDGYALRQDNFGNTWLNANDSRTLSLAANGVATLQITPSEEIDCLQNDVIRLVMHPDSSAPSGGTEREGQMYYNTVSSDLFVWTGAAWTSLTAGSSQWTRVAGTPDIVHPNDVTNTAVGIGTATVPHNAGIGLLAIDGPANSAVGPSVQFTVTTDDFPTMQLMNWAHDNMAILFDAYWSGTAWTSSDPGSNFKIAKAGDDLRFDAKSGVTAGSVISSWTIGMLMNANGTVGIGTDAPDSRLHVFSGSAGAISAFAGTILTVEHSANAYISILTPSANESGIFFGSTASTIDGGIIYNNPSIPQGMQFRVAGNSTKMVILSSGKIGIGTTVVPHGAVGAAMFALEAGSASTAGPHIQITTTLDDYPLVQHRHWEHDNISIAFDAYHDGTGWRSSDPGSNFKIHKVNNLFRIDIGSGVTAGSFVTFGAGMSMNVSGQVGIGNFAPSTKLHVTETAGGHGAIIGVAFVGNFSTATFAQFSHNTFRSDATGYGFLQSSVGETFMNSAGTRSLFFRNQNVTNMTMTSTGFFGIGGAGAPTHTLQVFDDDAAKLTTTTWATTSDARTKQDIKPFGKGLDYVLAMPGLIEFEFNGEFGTPQGVRGVGFTAQQLQAVAPELVRETDGGVLKTNLHELFMAAINAIAELNQKIVVLEKQIKDDD